MITCTVESLYSYSSISPFNWLSVVYMHGSKSSYNLNYVRHQHCGLCEFILCVGLAEFTAHIVFVLFLSDDALVI